MCQLSVDVYRSLIANLKAELFQYVPINSLMLFCCECHHQMAVAVMMGKPAATQGGATIGFAKLTNDTTVNSVGKSNMSKGDIWCKNGF